MKTMALVLGLVLCGCAGRIGVFDTLDPNIRCSYRFRVSSDTPSYGLYVKCACVCSDYKGKEVFAPDNFCETPEALKYGVCVVK
jgi:hypothetical protein